MKGRISRRELLKTGTIYGGGMLLAWQLPRPRAAAAAAQSAEPASFSAADWKTVEAITARIIPSDHEPGAREAHCVNFIDKALAHEDAAALPVYHAGIAGTDAAARAAHGKPFVALEAAQQDALLAALQAGTAAGWPEGAVPSPVFFETVRAQTIIGFLADPKYGGNRGHAGWRVTRYPGPRHRLGGYTPEQMVGKQTIKTVWGQEL